VARYLIDTNIVAEATRPPPSPAVTTWFSTQDDHDLFVATLTLGVLERGILQLPPSCGRRELDAWFAGPEGPPLLFPHRILSFDPATASVWARLMAEGHAGGRPRSALDMIAATAVVHDCVVVTANERHFRDVVAFINPTAST
jgi:predicted nucleic acid-binding protein